VSPRRLPAPLVAAVLRPGYRFLFSPRRRIVTTRRLMELATSAAPLPTGSTVRMVTLGGRPAERITVGASNRPRAVLYLHGGAYTLGSPATHRAATAYLARESGAVVYSLDYRLAPEHPYPAAVDDAIAAFRELASTWPASRVAISGDSAGGGIAVAAARRLIDDHDLHPAALALFSPHTDAADDDFPAPRDMVVNVKWGRANSDRYAAGADLRTPGISPIHGNLAGLPPMWVEVGRRELLHRQILRFVAAAGDAGSPVTLVEHPTLWHSGHAQAGLIREADEVLHQAGVFLRARLDAASSADDRLTG
jgi:monoterpene epsilon-lactone hydrolase